MNPVVMGTELRRMFRYGLVGLANTGVFSGMAWLTSLTGMHYSLYTACSYAVAIVFSFFMNKSFTFAWKGVRPSRVFLKFLGVSLSLLLVAEGVQYVLIEAWGQRELVGVAGGMIVYTGVGYLVNRLWVFSPGEQNS